MYDLNENRPLSVHGLLEKTKPVSFPNKPCCAPTAQNDARIARYLALRALALGVQINAYPWPWRRCEGGDLAVRI